MSPSPIKIFLDANVLIAVLNREYPLYPLASRILSLCENPRYLIYTSPVCLAIAFYFSEKKSGNSLARQKIAQLSSRIQATTTDQDVVNQTIRHKQVHDFEDGLEYFSAVNAGCQTIVTEDKGDFYFSEIVVMNCEEFLLTPMAYQ